MKKSDGNLKGTTRTLDMIDGECPLEDGIMSKNGFAVLADKGKVLTEVGDIAGNSVSTIDLYLFAYGRDYRQALKDFYQLTGTHQSFLGLLWEIGGVGITITVINHIWL